MSVTTLAAAQRVRAALAELDAAIARAKGSREDQLDHLELLAWAGRPTTGVLAWLRRTDAHLDALRRDRLWLLGGEAAAEADRGGGGCRRGR
jgi:hypothetical protein